VSVMNSTLDDASVGPSAIVASMAQKSLVEIYQKYFDYRIVKNEADRTAAHLLRYKVYCEETGFENKNDHQYGIERDEYDSHAVQSILLHKHSRQTVGTVRLVLPIDDQPGCALPTRQFAALLNNLPDSILPCATTAEISRLAIHTSFRRRLSDGLYANIFADGDDLGPDFDPRRIIPHITLGLFTSIFQMVRETKLTHLCAIIDPALLRMLARLGLHFHKAGDKIDFHGPRQPVYISGEELLSRLADEQPDIYDLIVASNDF
jgi:N-acyl amino acid synthase of PEP-CTERM/exosortase system